MKFLPLTCPYLFGLFSCDGRFASSMYVYFIVFLISSLQAAPVAAEPKAAEAPEPSPETQETGEAKADAVEEVKETAETSYAENVCLSWSHVFLLLTCPCVPVWILFLRWKFCFFDVCVFHCISHYFSAGCSSCSRTQSSRNARTKPRDARNWRGKSRC